MLLYFANFNKFLQLDATLIYKLYNSKRASWFIKHNTIQHHKDSENSFSSPLFNIQVHEYDTGWGIGTITYQKLRNLLNTGNICQNDADKIFESVHNFIEKNIIIVLVMQCTIN